MFTNLSVFLIIFIQIEFTLAQFESPVTQFQSRLTQLGNRNKTEAAIKSFYTSYNYRRLAKSSTLELIREYEYPAEGHKVETKDGYILTLHRIPHGRWKPSQGKGQGQGQSRKKRPVVFLQHGFIGSSYEWMVNSRENLLPLRLADAGYDVWLGNFRGCPYSREHVSLKDTDRKFWDFDLDHLGKYDLPAAIDFILGRTGETKLNYIGFSMGTTTFFIMMSHHPSFNNKIKIMIALAPVVFINNIQGAVRIMTHLETNPRIKNWVHESLRDEFVTPMMIKTLNTLGRNFCSIPLIARTICAEIYDIILGWKRDPGHPILAVIEHFPLLFGNFPSPTSVRTGGHFLQFIQTGFFREYDYGTQKNKLKYNATIPPDYSLANAKVPIALIWSENDALADVDGVHHLEAKLPNLISSIGVNLTYWNHFDFHLGRKAHEIVNVPVLKLLAAAATAQSQRAPR